LEVIGAHNSAHPPVETPNSPWTIARDVELFLDWQNAGRVDVRPLITHRYPWREAPGAFEMLLADRTQAVGVVIDWSMEGCWLKDRTIEGTGIRVLGIDGG